MKKQEIIIIGAPRSGTNLLRDLICSQNEFGTWPCDEINYIWRHLNKDFCSDEFPVELARNSVKKYIRKKFSKAFKDFNCKYLVEKTCANSLRVDFIREVLPNAKFIFIFRDGIDCVYSASVQWYKKPNFKYILKKARFIPFGDILFYASNYAINLGYRFLNKNSHYKYWGPKFRNWKMFSKQKDLKILCAYQWKFCNERALSSFKKMDPNLYLFISYKELTNNPEKTINIINNFIDPSKRIDLNKDLIKKVYKNSKKGEKEIETSLQEEIKQIINPVQNVLNDYEK